MQLIQNRGSTIHNYYYTAITACMETFPESGGGMTSRSDTLYMQTVMSMVKTRAVLRLVWPFDGIVQKHIHKRLI